MILKRIAAVCFAISFLMAIVLFTRTGVEYIPLKVAKPIFLICGALGLLFNLLAFRTGKNSPGFNLMYWLGSIIIFIGLAFILMHWPYGYYIVILGMGVIGLSFFFKPNLDEEDQPNDLLDDFK